MLRLQELIRLINERPTANGLQPSTTVPKNPPRPTSRPKFDFPESGKAVDGLRVAMNLFRDNDFDSALRAFRLIDAAQLGREDRAFVQYMTACCLRRLNRRSDAAAIYREVADAHEDEFISECAINQLALIRSAQELEAQREQLRPRPKNR